MSLRRFVIAIFMTQLVGVAAHAQLPAARLSTVFPPGAQQGTSIDVTVTGVDLDELTGLHFSAPGITAEPKLDPATKARVPNVFTVHVAKEIRPGAYDVRAVGRFGVTNPRAFVVDRYPQAAAKPGNISPETAAEVALNSGAFAAAVVNGAQFFRVTLKSNARVFIEADGVALDSRMEPVLVLFDAAGREVAKSSADGLIDVTPASDGAYVVKVHDVLFRGGPEYFYRLRIYDGPRIDAILPPAFRADDVVETQLLARPAPQAFRMLDPLGDADSTSLRANWLLGPGAAMLDGVQHYAFAGATGPVFLGRAAAPLVAEQADNDEPAKAQKVNAPLEVYGRFHPRNDRDWVALEAKKDQAFWVEVVSNRLLSPLTDPMVLVQRVTKNDKGEEAHLDVKEAYEPENVPNMPREFYAAHRDPAFVFVAPADGTYRLLVRDLFNTNSDEPRRIYRLCIAPASERQDFRLVAWPLPPQPLVMNPPITQSWGSNLRPGGVMPISVLAFRTGGYGGEISLTAENLPAGVTCPPVTISNGTNSATLMLVADEKAPPAVAPIRIVGTASPGSASRITRTARAGTFVWTVPNQELEPLRSRVARELVMAVTSGEPEPIAVRAAEEKVWETSIVSPLEIPLKVTRRMGFAGVVNLNPVGPTPQVIALPPLGVAADTAESKWTLDAGAVGLGVGTHTVHLQATSVGTYDRYPAQFAAAKAAKEAAEKATPELAAAVAKAKETAAAAKTPEESAAAAKAVAAAEEKVKQNEAAKTAAAEQIKNLTPKEVTAYSYSPPITLKVAAAPITLSVAPLPAPLKPGGKVEVPVTITRLYGFNSVVELSTTLPQGVAGLSAAKVTIPADKTQGVLTLQAAVDAKPGDYTLTVTGALGQNGRPAQLSQPLSVKVVAP